MPKYPLITVIVPVYKTERYIERCISSIQNQTYTNLEIILVNDGSPDNSGKLCDSFAQNDNRIKVMHQINKGQAAARNCGIKEAHGELIAFVDSDDWILPEMYMRLYESLLKTNAKISCCGIKRFYGETHVSYFNPNLDDELLLNTRQALFELLNNHRITSSPCDKLFRREVIDGNLMNEGMIFEDFEVMPRWLIRADRIVYTGRAMYCYRTTAQSTMTTSSVKRFDEVKASQMRLDFYKKYFPEYSKIAVSKHIESCLNVLSYTRKNLKCVEERIKLRRVIMDILNQENEIKLPKLVRLKIFILAFGLPTYDVVNRIYNANFSKKLI